MISDSENGHLSSEPIPSPDAISARLVTLGDQSESSKRGIPETLSQRQAKRSCPVARSFQLDRAPNELWEPNGNVFVKVERDGNSMHLRLTKASLRSTSTVFTRLLEVENSEDESVFLVLSDSADSAEAPTLGRVPVQVVAEEDWANKGPEAAVYQDIAVVKLEPTEEPPTGFAPNNSSTLLIDAYRNLFLVIRNAAPPISTTNIGIALVQSESLLDLARQYDCSALVIPHITTTLVDHRQQFFSGIAFDPPRWLQLSMKLRSGIIFCESITHVIGAWPAWPWRTPKAVLTPGLTRLIQERSTQMHMKTIEVDRTLLLNTITIEERNGDCESPVTIKSSVGTYFTVQIWRDYMVNQMHNLDNLSAARRALARGSFYRCIGGTGEAYLPLAELLQNIKDLGGSALAAREDAAEDLKLLKDYAKGVVKDLVRNGLMLDVEQAGIGYLTCVEISSRDYPWLV